MRMFQGGSAGLIFKLLASGTAKEVGHIARDAIVIMSLLGALTAIHFVSRYTGARPEFLAMFTALHEYCFLGTYALLAAKSLLRLWKI